MIHFTYLLWCQEHSHLKTAYCFLPATGIISDPLAMESFLAHPPAAEDPTQPYNHEQVSL